VGFLLRVLARPWAEVSVDGITVDTTPTARAIPLAPGPHFVRLRNPAYATEDRAVQVTAGRHRLDRRRPSTRGGAPCA
jgi:hypothetical protein